MSLAAAVVLGLALLALGGFIVLSLGLFTQGKAVLHAAASFRDEIAPVMAEISAGGAEAQGKMARIRERVETLQEAQARLRRRRSSRRR
ncbi:MAG: hypothetical protein WD670_02225 [Actinomycetota bacterium]